jgi:hypothetical protein
MKGSSFECGDLQSHSLPGTGDNDLAVRGGLFTAVRTLDEPSSDATGRASQPIAGPEFKQRQIAFLNRVPTAPDPQQRVIDRAMLNDQNELGLILDRSVEMNRSPELLHTLVAQSVGRMQLGYDASLLIANFDCTN